MNYLNRSSTDIQVNFRLFSIGIGMCFSYGLDHLYFVNRNSVSVSENMISRSVYQIRQQIPVPLEEPKSSVEPFSNSRTFPSARNKNMPSVSRSKKDVARDQLAFFIVKYSNAICALHSTRPAALQFYSYNNYGRYKEQGNRMRRDNYDNIYKAQSDQISSFIS